MLQENPQAATGSAQVANPQAQNQNASASGVAPVATGGSMYSGFLTWALIAGYVTYAAKEAGWLLVTKLLAPEYYFSLNFKEFFLDGLELSIITYLFLGFMLSPLSVWLKSNPKLNAFWKQAAVLPALLGVLVLIDYPIGLMGSIGILVITALYSVLYGRLLEKGVGKHFQ